MTVTLILVAALMRVFTATASTWQHGEAQVDAYREARGALQLMARDLSATLQASSVPTPTPTPSTSGTTSTTGPLLPTLLLQRAQASADSTGPGNEEVYCLTNIPNSGSSSLCAVGYYCKWMPDLDGRSNTPHAYALMRQSSDSNDTFQRLKAATQGSPLRFADLFSQTTGTPVPKVQPLASYIWDLRFRIDTDLNEDDFPDGDYDKVPKDHVSSWYQDTAASKPGYPTNLPPYVEIRFKALSAAATRRLEGNSNVNQQTWYDTGAGGLINASNSAVYQTLIRPNLQQFILRVPFIGAAPLPTSTAAPTP